MDSTFTLPNLHADWPFRRTLNPHYESVAAASTEWVESLHVLNKKAQANFNRCKFPLLAALTYPRADREYLWSACSLINWFFVFDALSDVSDGASTREMVARLKEIIRDPLEYVPDGRSALEVMTARFLSRSLAIASASSAKRFAKSIELYIEAVCQEAEDREAGRVRTIEEYIALRRDTVGAKPSFDFLVWTKDIPEEVMKHPCIDRLTWSAVDLIILSNDIYSFNVERSQGLGNHNIVSAAMAEKGLDIQGAIDYVGSLFREEAKRFMEESRTVPSFSEEIDEMVSEYIFGLANWVTGGLEWSFESERYFGARGPEIKSSRVVKLLPVGLK